MSQLNRTTAVVLLTLLILLGRPVAAADPTPIVNDGLPTPWIPAAGLRILGQSGPDVFLGVVDLDNPANRVTDDLGGALPVGYHFTSFSYTPNQLRSQIPAYNVDLLYDFSSMPGPPASCPPSKWDALVVRLTDQSSVGGLGLSYLMLLVPPGAFAAAPAADPSIIIGSFPEPDGLPDVAGTPGLREWWVSGIDFGKPFTLYFDVIAAGDVSAGEALKLELYVGCSQAPLAVTLSDLWAVQVGNAVHVRWETNSEIDNRGFNVWRGASADGPERRLNGLLIQSSSPGGPGGHAYNWRDSDGLLYGVDYFYWLEDVDMWGNVTRHGPVSVNFQMPTAVAAHNTAAAADRPDAAPLALLGLALIGLSVWAKRGMVGPRRADHDPTDADHRPAR